MSPFTTVNESGSKASASSNTEPKSSSTAARSARAVRRPSSHTQNSRYSVRVKSMPVTDSDWVMERHRGSTTWGFTQLGFPVTELARPRTVSGFKVSHSTGSAD